MTEGVASRTHIDWDEVYKTHGRELARLEEFVESYEKEYQISLTPGAIEMMFIPLVETLETGGKLDFAEVTSTFSVMIRTIKEAPSPKDKKAERSSFSVIRAFWRAWCNVPPFCDDTKQG
jgi:hypothetical protein